MIKTFRSKETENLYRRQRSKRFAAIELVARRKLRQIDSATELRDLASPPGNRLEALRNDQWRICFNWLSGEAYDVEIVDYH